MLSTLNCIAAIDTASSRFFINSRNGHVPAGGAELRAAQGPPVHAGQPDVSPLAHGGQEVRTHVPELDRSETFREGDPPSRRQHARRFVGFVVDTIQIQIQTETYKAPVTMKSATGAL